MNTLAERPLQRMCARALAGDAERPAIEYAGRWTSWGELRAVAKRLEGLLLLSGVPETASIVFIPRNRPASVAALLGMLAGARTVRMVYAFQSSNAVARELDGLSPVVVVAGAEDFSPEVCSVLRARGAVGIALSSDDALLVAGLERAHGEDRSCAPAQPQVEILTSGTTGAPKRFAISHDMIAEHIVGANKNYQATGVDYARQPPPFLYYPLGNISGIYTVVPTLLKGHRLTLVERFTVDAWREHLRRHRPERASLPPAGVQMVLDANVPCEELAGVRSIATGAASLSLSVQRAFEARYKIPILASYGATEFGGPVTSMTAELHERWGDTKAGSVGLPIAGAQLRVVDAETGEPLGPDQQGLLEVISPRIGDRWIRTSDLAVIDSDGFLFHRGRADGAIMRGGFKLLPETIERALLSHPSVADAVVVGVPDARLGQVPAAVVQLRAGSLRPTVIELERHARDFLYATHIPALWRLVDELPRNASLKVDRAAVRRMLELRGEADAPRKAEQQHAETITEGS